MSGVSVLPNLILSSSLSNLGMHMEGAQARMVSISMGVDDWDGFEAKLVLRGGAMVVKHGAKRVLQMRDAVLKCLDDGAQVLWSVATHVLGAFSKASCSDTNATTKVTLHSWKGQVSAC